MPNLKLPTKAISGGILKSPLKHRFSSITSKKADGSKRSLKVQVPLSCTAPTSAVNQFNWENDEGLALETDGSEYQYLDPSGRTARRRRYRLNPFKRLKYTTGDYLVGSLGWSTYSWLWFAKFMKFLFLSCIFLSPALFSIFVYDHTDTNSILRQYWPGSKELWEEVLRPASFYLELVLFLYLFGALAYRLWIRFAHELVIYGDADGEIMRTDMSDGFDSTNDKQGKPVVSSHPVKHKSIFERFLRSNLFQIIIASSKHIFVTIFIGLLTVSFSFFFTVEIVESEIADEHSIVSSLDWAHQSLPFYVHRLLGIIFLGSALVTIEKLWMSKIIGNFYQTAYSVRLHDFCFAVQAIKRLYQHANETLTEDSMQRRFGGWNFSLASIGGLGQTQTTSPRNHTECREEMRQNLAIVRGVVDHHSLYGNHGDPGVTNLSSTANYVSAPKPLKIPIGYHQYKYFLDATDMDSSVSDEQNFSSEPNVASANATTANFQVPGAKPSATVDRHRDLSSVEGLLESREKSKLIAKVIFTHFYTGELHDEGHMESSDKFSDEKTVEEPRPSFEKINPPISSNLRRSTITSCQTITSTDYPSKERGKLMYHTDWRNFPILAHSLINAENSFSDLLTSRDIRKFLLLLDPSGSPFISPFSFKSFLVTLHKERARLAKSLQDHGRAVQRLENLAFILTLFLTLLLTPWVLGIPVGHLFATISGSLLTLSFMFGPSAAILFNSIIFMFITHPFDIGDRVFVDSDSYFVHEIGLFCTVFQRWDAVLIYYPNGALIDRHLVNIRRSRPGMLEWIDLVVESKSTNSSKLYSLSERLSAVILRETKDFDPVSNKSDTANLNDSFHEIPSEDTTSCFSSSPTSSLAVQVRAMEIMDSQYLRLGLLLRHKSNFQDGFLRARRHTKFLTALYAILNDLQIVYVKTPLRIELVKGEFPGIVQS